MAAEAAAAGRALEDWGAKELEATSIAVVIEERAHVENDEKERREEAAKNQKAVEVQSCRTEDSKVRCDLLTS